MKWDGFNIVVVLVLSGVLFLTLTLTGHQDSVSGLVAFLTSGVALFVQAQKSAPGGADTLTPPGASPRGQGDTTIVSPADEGLKIKKELLLREALNGEILDDAHEFKAEQTAQDIVNRASKWREWPVPDDTAARIPAAMNAPPPPPNNPAISSDQSVQPSEKKT